MKIKYLQFFIVLLLSNQIIGQSFDGIDVSGNYLDVVNKFKAKNYKESSRKGENIVILNGRTLNKEIDVVISYTPKSKEVYSFTIFFEKNENEYNLKKEYDNLTEIFIEKHGQPSANENQQNVYKYFKLWDKSIYRISLAVKKESNQIILGYFNAANSELYKKEKRELEKEVF